MERIAYTSRQLNSTSTSLQFFNLVLLCELEQLEDVRVTLLKCFDSTEVAYAYNTSTEGGQEAHEARKFFSMCENSSVS